MNIKDVGFYMWFIPGCILALFGVGSLIYGLALLYAQGAWFGATLIIMLISMLVGGSITALVDD